MINKFGEEMPETAEEIRELLSELKQELFILRRQNAPIGEYEAIRDKALRIDSWRTHLIETGKINWDE
jgi:hypothetical protein